jgi:hypothetical protein
METKNRKTALGKGKINEPDPKTPTKGSDRVL